MYKYALAMCLLSTATMANVAHAQTLKIALSSEPTAIDPHYHDLTPNNGLVAHIFDGLTDQDETLKVKPSLATSWENDGGKTWTFKLREGVKFSDGTPFSAKDVIFTFCRTMNNETSVAGSFADITQNFVSVKTPDENTLVIETKASEPLLPELLSGLSILSASIVDHGEITFDPENKCGVTGAWPAVNDFNDGKKTIGTGPYKLKTYMRGSAVELERNENYWGEQEPWEAVKLVPVPSAGPRLAGLLAGDYDVIENPAARDLGRIKDDKRFETVMAATPRVIYYQFDVGRDKSPYVEAANGKNPLQDVKVRQAISLGIDRKAIIDRLMDGAAIQADQFIPAGMFGTLLDAEELRYDPAEAKKLLAEAGYPDGFKLTLSTTNDRYINDSQITQAVAQYLSQIGIQAEVDAMTRAIYFPRRSAKELSVAIGGWGSTSGEASSFLRQWAATPNAEGTLGGSNYGGYSNPEADKLIYAAIQEMDDEKRSAQLQDALRLVLNDYAFVPLHYESAIWAYKSNLDVKGRADQFTTAMSVKPVK